MEVHFFNNFQFDFDEESSLARLAARVPDQRLKCAEPCHFMIDGLNAGSGKDDADLTVARALAAKLGAHIAPGLQVISVRLLLSPPGAPAQPWHLDYGQHFREIRTVFLALTPARSNNCTETLRFGRPEESARVHALARSANGPLAPSLWADERASARAEPLLMERGQVCALRTSHVFHRRSANRSNYTRITFNVDLAWLVECARFIDLDTQRSLACGRIAGREEVDELSEQDVSLEPVTDTEGVHPHHTVEAGLHDAVDRDMCAL